MARGKLPEGIIWRTINGARVAINPKTGTAVAGAGGRLNGRVLNWYDDMGPMPKRLVPQTTAVETPKVGPGGQRGLALGPDTLGSGVGGEQRGKALRAEAAFQAASQDIADDIKFMLYGEPGRNSYDSAGMRPVLDDYVDYLVNDGGAVPAPKAQNKTRGGKHGTKASAIAENPYVGADDLPALSPAERREQLKTIRDFVAGERDTLGPLGDRIAQQAGVVGGDAIFSPTRTTLANDTLRDMDIRPLPSRRVQAETQARPPVTPGRPSTPAELRAARDRAEAALAKVPKEVEREMVYAGTMGRRPLVKMSDGTYRTSKDGEAYASRDAALGAMKEQARQRDKEVGARMAARDRAAMGDRIDKGESIFTNRTDVARAREVAKARGLEVIDSGDSIIILPTPKASATLGAAKATAREILDLTSGMTGKRAAEARRIAKRIDSGKGTFRDLEDLRNLRGDLEDRAATERRLSATSKRQVGSTAPTPDLGTADEWAGYRNLGAPKSVKGWSGRQNGFGKEEVGRVGKDGQPERVQGYTRGDFAIVPGEGTGSNYGRRHDIIHIPTGMTVSASGMSRTAAMKVVKEATKRIDQAGVRDITRTPAVGDVIDALTQSGAREVIRG